MATARDLCTQALQKCGAFADIAPIPARDMDIALQTLNQVVAHLSVEAEFPSYDYLITGNINSTQSDYTLGATGDFVTARVPSVVKSMQYKSGNVWFDMIQLAFSDLISSEGVENQQSMPTWYSYQRTTDSTGEIRIYPRPSQTFPIRITATIMLPEYELDDVVTLPSAYEGALIWETARILTLEYDNPSKEQQVTQEARRRIEILKRMANRPKRAVNDFLSSRGRWDIRGDGYVGGGFAR